MPVATRPASASRNSGRDEKSAHAGLGRIRVDERAAALVHDDDSAAGLARVVLDERAQGRELRRRLLEHVVGDRRDGHGVALDLRGQGAALVSRVRDSERHLEDEEHERGQREIAEQQPPAHARRR